jgi:hypothetical protein
MTTPIPAKVHITIPGFIGASEMEIPRPHDGCAVAAEMMALHICSWVNPAIQIDANTLSRIRQNYIDNKRWNISQGTTLANILWHLQTAFKADFTNGRIAGYIPFSSNPDYSKLHDFIKQQTLAQNPVICEVANAQALPHNEQGIFYHFITLGGIDSDAGYFCGNSDTLDAIGDETKAIIPIYWAGWNTLANARICGAISLRRNDPPPPVNPNAADLLAIENAVNNIRKRLNITA